MLFTKTIKPPESSDKELRRLYEHVVYMQQTLEIKFADLERKLAAAEKAIEALRAQNGE